MVFGLAVILMAGGSGSAAAGESAPGSEVANGAAPHTELPLERYIRESLASNSALQAQDFAVESALRGLEAARGRRGPVLGLNARYTVSDGGRTIEIPTGDLVNPVYRTLNQLTAGTANATAFPEIGNNEIRFLRPHEQDTRLNLTAPLYAPQISAEIHVRAAQLDGSRAAREAFARTLVRDVKAAYFRVASAEAGVAVLEASRASLAENLRVASALVTSGKATRDQRLRADAELLAIEQQLRAARNQARAAQRYLNLLRNREEETSIEIVEPSAEAQAPSPGRDDDPPRLRPELQNLDAQIATAEGSRKLAQASYLPTLALVADTGIQGTGYRANRDDRVSTASLVVSWTLFDFGTRRASVSQAAAQANQLRALRDDTRRQLRLATQNAEDALATARDALATAEARNLAAEESFRVSERKRDAGQLSQFEFIDAERSRTEARLGIVFARSDLSTAEAEVEYTRAAYVLPPLFSRSAP